MASSTFKCLTFILFLSALVITEGARSICNLNFISIHTQQTWRVIQGKPEWVVIVVNNCSCAQSHIRLSCEGFQSVEEVDPAVFSEDHKTETCLLINGGLLKAKRTITFTYAWDYPLPLAPISSIVGPC